MMTHDGDPDGLWGSHDAFSLGMDGLDTFVDPPPQVNYADIWRAIHTYAWSHRRYDIASEAWLERVIECLPCAACRRGVRGFLIERPPGDFFSWTVALHNRVNAALGRPIISDGEAALRHGLRHGDDVSVARRHDVAT